MGVRASGDAAARARGATGDGDADDAREHHSRWCHGGALGRRRRGVGSTRGGDAGVVRRVDSFIHSLDRSIKEPPGEHDDENGDDDRGVTADERHAFARVIGAHRDGDAESDAEEE